MAGVTDPLALHTMHHVLDVVELMIVEALQTNDEIQRFYYRTYQPDPQDMTSAGFSIEETDASFDAFTSALGDMH
jgi:hypothetical protein